MSKTRQALRAIAHHTVMRLLDSRPSGLPPRETIDRELASVCKDPRNYGLTDEERKKIREVLIPRDWEKMNRKLLNEGIAA